MKIIVILAASFVFSLGVSAQGDPVDPFKTPAPEVRVDTPPPPASTTLDAYQFNGMMKFGGVVSISLFDTKQRKAFWVTEDEVGKFGIHFSGYNSKANSVVIKQGGLTKKLVLTKAKIETLKIASSRGSNAVADPTAAVTGVASQGNNAGGRVETDDEAKERIRRVAEEIRRRRAERRKKLQQRSQ